MLAGRACPAGGMWLIAATPVPVPVCPQECAAGTVMGGGLGVVIMAFCYLWSGISTQVGVTVAISLPVGGRVGTGTARLRPPRLQPAPQPPLGGAPRGTTLVPRRRDRLFPLRPALLCLPQVVSLWANLLGGVFPLLSSHLGFNPAVTSAPLMTTVVDSTGLILYFGIAKAVMGI